MNDVTNIILGNDMYTRAKDVEDAMKSHFILLEMAKSIKARNPLALALFIRQHEGKINLNRPFVIHDEVHTLVSLACTKQDVDCLDILFINGANVSAKIGSGMTALHLACTKGNNVAVIKCCLENGAEVNEFDYSKWTPLHMASIVNDKANVECLLDHGADPYVCTSDNESPIYTAVVYDAADVMQLYLQRGMCNDLQSLKEYADIHDSSNVLKVISSFEKR